MAPKKKKNFLSGVADALGQIAEVVSSAGELLVDAELRRKGAQYIVQEASRGINEAQRGLEAGADALGRSIQQGAKARFGAGARQLQSVLRNIERQIQDFQRQQQQRDLASELEHHHKLPVDIQIGDQVFEDMPQEMRSRFWYVLLERPDLAQQLLRTGTSAATAPAAATSSHLQQQGDDAAGTSSSTSRPGTPAACGSQAPGTSSAQAPVLEGSAGSPFAPYASGSSQAADHAPAPQPAPQQRLVLQEQQQDAGGTSSSAGGGMPQPVTTAGAAAGSGEGGACSSSQQPGGSIPDMDDLLLQPSASGTVPPASSAAAVDCTVPSGSAAAEAVAAAALPQAPSPWTSGHNETSLDPPVNAADVVGGAAAAGPGLGNSALLAPSPWDSLRSSSPAAVPASTEATAAAAQAGAASSEAADAGASSQAGTAAAAVAAEAPGVAVAGPPPSMADGEGWEMVSRDVPHVKQDSSGALEALDTVRTLVESMAEEAALDDQRAAKQAVFQAMLEVPWVAGEGIPDSPTDGTQYAELLKAGCGSIEEVILRDVPRTFPEHPFFSTQDGQQKLLRVLTAYAAADPEVGYCQGMAFAAGVLLMYMPEEPAFRLYQRLMSPEGPNLRRYYLPGLEHLKLELSCFELLLSSHQPQLHQHLLDAGLPALLYAAQWLMTTYACPYPVHVAARVLDVLLQSDSDAMLPRLGLAVMEALSHKLLELEDFEELITYLKVKPLSWPLHMHRKVFEAALSSAATDAELQAAAAAAREEFVRSGRAASFSSKHLSRQTTVSGTQRHELVPGPMGPRTLAATEAAAAGAVAAVDGAAPTEAGSGSDAGSGSGAIQPTGEAGALPGGDSGVGSSSQQQQQLSGRLSSTHDAVLVGPASSGIVVDELDALEDLITDLDLLLPGGASETDSELGSPEPLLSPQQQQQQNQQRPN